MAGNELTQQDKERLRAAVQDMRAGTTPQVQAHVQALIAAAGGGHAGILRVAELIRALGEDEAALALGVRPLPRQRWWHRLRRA